MPGSKRKPTPPRGLRSREGNWHYRFELRGHEYTGNTGLAATGLNVNDALKIRADERQRILTGQSPKPELFPFNKASQQFLEWCDGEYREHPSSAGRIRTSFASIELFFGSEPVRNLQAGRIEDYKTWRRKQRIKEITIRHDLHALSVFFQYAQRQGWSTANPVRDVEIPSDQDAIRMYILTPDEEELYFAAARQYPTLCDIERIMILQGCRPEEVMALEQANIFLDRGEFSITRGKSAAARRTLAILPETREILIRRLRAPNRWVFPSPRYPGRPLTKINNPHNKLVAELGLPVVPYDMRHTFATRYALRGCPLPLLAAILGHGNLRSVQKYIHPNQANISDAVRRFAHPDGPSGFRPASGSKPDDSGQSWANSILR